MMRSFIDCVGTLVVAFVFAIILVTIMNPVLTFTEKLTGVDLVGTAWPNDGIYIGTWILLALVLHYFVFRKRKYKKRTR